MPGFVSQFLPVALCRRWGLVLTFAAALLLPAGSDLWGQLDVTLLSEVIVSYNRMAHEKSLEDGSYRGEEGVLRLNPDVAKSLGLKVAAEEAYQRAMELAATAETLLAKAIGSLSTPKEESIPGGHLESIAEYVLSHKRTREAAAERFKEYRSHLNPQNDQRLEDRRCITLLEKILKQSLEETGYNLREGLGRFYNRCKGTERHGAPLTPQNIQFVNHVYSVFVERAPDPALAMLDLDRMTPPSAEPGPIRYGIEWRRVARLAGFNHVSDMASAIQNQGAEGYPVDPLFFLALVKQESNFNHAAVSSLGAAGLTQIMPKTALDMGLEEIFMPGYYEEAMTLLARERSLRNEAVSLLLEMDEQNRFQKADRASQMMQEALQCADRKSELLTRYRRALLKDGTDARLRPRAALQCGLNYLGEMLKAHDGDMSLALAAYSAGAGRIKQYGGIPPYTETISFRNSVLAYYRGYLNQAKGARHVSWGNQLLRWHPPTQRPNDDR